MNTATLVLGASDIVQLLQGKWIEIHAAEDSSFMLTVRFDNEERELQKVWDVMAELTAKTRE